MSRFNSMPNFRPLTTGNKEDIAGCMETDETSNNENESRGDDVHNRVTSESVTRRKWPKTGKIYRSSRPDFLTEAEFEQFRKINFKSIIDFRSFSEYKKSHPVKLIDQYYAIYKVKMPIWRIYKPDESITCVPVKYPETNNSCLDVHSSIEKKHYLINFFNLSFVWVIFNRIPIFWRIVSIFYLLYDTILNNERKHFVRFFAKRTINHQGLAGQYIDFIDYSQTSICAALKLLCNPENIPVMLNCAHGKDRTGVVSAFVLSCLGYSKEYICDDYAKSTEELERVRDLLERDIVERYQLCRSFMDSNSQTMKQALDHVENKYGSVSSYLQGIGFSLQEQQQLRNNLMS